MPYVVDGSASEIQCFVDDYYFYGQDGVSVVTESGMGVPGLPACCEVCSTREAADVACTAMCKYWLCDRARDDHVAVGQELGVCETQDCGFDLGTCMESVGNLQTVDLVNVGGNTDFFYTLITTCAAHATDLTRPDGLFHYLEGLDGIPGARGDLAEVDDVVGYCQDQQVGGTVGASSSTTAPSADPDPGADSTGDDAGEGIEPPPRPRSCGPYAERRFWVRPTNNFGAWNGESSGLGMDAGASHPVTIVGGGIAYTRLPCQGANSEQCVRIDQLSVGLLDPSSGLLLSLTMTQSSALISVSSDGYLEIPAGGLRFAVHYEQDGEQTLVMADNHEVAQGHIDARAGSLSLTDITGSSEDGTMLAQLSLHTELQNTQPMTEIIHEPGPGWNQVSLTARTLDAEHDPIEHEWSVPGVGSWTDDHIVVELPVGRHPVILRADDIHRSRSIDALWVDIEPAPPSP